MELGESIFFKINNMNCKFKTLHETDVTQDYVNGLKFQKEYIMNTVLKEYYIRHRGHNINIKRASKKEFDHDYSYFDHDHSSSNDKNDTK